jgi:hypothetical protein
VDVLIAMRVLSEERLIEFFCIWCEEDIVDHRNLTVSCWKTFLSSPEVSSFFSPLSSSSSSSSSSSRYGTQTEFIGE